MAFGIGADHHHRVVTQVRGRPDRPVGRVHHVGATARMRRQTTGLDQRLQRAFLGVDHGHPATGVGGDEEVAMGRIQTAVMQEPLGLDLGGLEVLDVGIVDQKDLSGLLHVDDELRPVMRGQDRGDTRLGVVDLLVIDHAAGRDDLERLQSVAVHDYVLWRPVGAGDRVLVLEALELRGLDRTRLGSDLDLGDGVRLFHPQVDHVDLGIAADHEEIAARGRDPADMHRVAGVDHRLDLVAGAVDQGDLPESRRVTENRLSMSMSFIFSVGRSSGAISTFQLAFISGMPNSGGAGGSSST